MAGSFNKGAIPPDPRVVIPTIEDHVDVAALADGPPLITDSKNVRG